MAARRLHGHWSDGCGIYRGWHAPHTRQYIATKWGVDYFRDHGVQITVRVPAFRIMRKTRVDGEQYYVRCAPFDSPSSTTVLNLTDDEMLEHIPNLGLVSANATPEQQQAQA